MNDLENQLQQVGLEVTHVGHNHGSNISFQGIQKRGSHISELEGTLIEQNTRLQEYYDHIREQDSNMQQSLKNEIGRYRYCTF